MVIICSSDPTLATMICSNSRRRQADPIGNDLHILCGRGRRLNKLSTGAEFLHTARVYVGDPG